MVIAGDFKNGVTFELDGSVLQVVEFQHVKPGKGAAFVRTKLKNVITGAVTERTFSPTDKFEPARIERKEMQYSYNDGDLYYFMDMETYDQLPLSKEQVGDAMRYLVENSVATIERVNDKIISVNPPLFVNLKIVDCEPAVQGNTSKSAMKSAKLETGFTVKVPLFVAQGDTIKIDTRTGEYLERV